ncbi:GNAT family N-acetyltransferase [Kriegella sp. EG-1]|nr:GNAT family N-acetyltransferase [Flavobacteriaceae bacterium EG-1]
MKQVRLQKTSDHYFKRAWELYQEAFPIEEQRSFDGQAKVLKEINYHFDILIEGEELIGFILWWDFENYKYIDHFATAKAHRNKGFGKLILNKLMESTDKPILLEVELPTSSINKRRIKFYERVDFQLNQHYYETPPLKIGLPPLQLLVMSYPNPISKKDLAIFVKKNHPIIFKDE